MIANRSSRRRTNTEVHALSCVAEHLQRWRWKCQHAHACMASLSRSRTTLTIPAPRALQSSMSAAFILGDGALVGRCEVVSNGKAEAVAKHALSATGEVARDGLIWR